MLIDRARIEEMVRQALTSADGGGTGANGAATRPVDSAGGLLLTPDRGVNIGEPFDPRAMAGILAATPARIVVGRTGVRYRTNTMLRFRADHAAAKDAVMSEVDPALLARLGLFEVASRAPDKPIFLQRPDLGRALSDAGREEIARRLGRSPVLVIIYGDGLSAAAINQNLPEFHGALLPALAARGIQHAPAFFVRHARVKIMDEIARLTSAQAALFVCGERPGLGFADSLSAYYIYQPAEGATDADREVISNINPRGRVPAEAARDVALAIERILRNKKSGVLFP
ncbi:MAG: ethanolamine ammonia-lyase small subunit [Myxococcales bacterium]|jgi:ethanolamine ammonia-lyase small subunit|nr:ethanolamine ammonia-lyase small subunit [Myxococcales bacterium]